MDKTRNSNGPSLDNREWLEKTYQIYFRNLGNKDKGVAVLIQEDLAEVGIHVSLQQITSRLIEFNIRPVKDQPERLRGSGPAVGMPMNWDEVSGSPPKIQQLPDSGVRRRYKQPPKELISPPIEPSVKPYQLMSEWGINEAHARLLSRVIGWEEHERQEFRRQNELANASAVDPLVVGDDLIGQPGLSEIRFPGTEKISLDYLRRKSLQALELKIGTTFSQVNLLDQALTHSSFVAEANEEFFDDNEILEYVGDGVLKIIIRHSLVSEHSKLSEGVLTQIENGLVCTESLAKVGEYLELGELIRFSKGQKELFQKGEGKERLLASSFEALVAAVYIDKGFDIAARFVLDLLDEVIGQVDPSDMSLIKSPKSLLQELVQGELNITPEYSMVSKSGPDNSPEFVVEVKIGDMISATAKGGSKREAEREAAKIALQKLKEANQD